MSFPGSQNRLQYGFSKHLSPERLDLEIWPFIEPSGGQKRNREVKSVSTDPFGAATEAPEPSCGRIGGKSAEKLRVWNGKIEP